MEGYAGMGLQRLLVEKKVALYDSQKHGFLLRRSATLPCAQWSLSEKTSGYYLLIQEGVLTIPTKKRQKVKIFRKDFLIFLQKNGQHKCQPFTIPTFQTLNVRFSVKIFAKKFEPAQKQAPISG